MHNKKGILWIGEFVGFLFFVIIALIFILLFSQCSVSKNTENYDKIKFSKEELQVKRQLDTFFELPNSENVKNQQLIIEALTRYLIDENTGNLDQGVDLDEQNQFKNEVSEIISGYFNSRERFMLILESGGIIFDSYNRPSNRHIGYFENLEGKTTLVIPIGNDQFFFIEAVLQK
jgi:hypothetical protein